MSQNLVADQMLRPASPSPSSISTAALLPSNQAPPNQTRARGEGASTSHSRVWDSILRSFTTVSNSNQRSSTHPPQTRNGQNVSPMRQASRPDQGWKEWKSWKIQWPWLVGQFVVLLGIIVTIITLDQISRNSNGFTALGSAPWFIASDPAVDQAIWQQGLVYTALPAFFMTLYRAAWDSTVSHLAERQPYVELGKKQGRPAAQTLLLDYKAESSLLVWITAFKNGHLLLGACMLSSAVLAIFVIPLVSFLFTPNSFTLETPFALHFETSYNWRRLRPTPDLSNLRPALESAAGIRLHDTLQYPWTQDIYAFPKFTPDTEVNDGSLIVNTTALYSTLDCVALAEEDYHKTTLPPEETGIPGTVIEVDAWDRGCATSSSIVLRNGDTSTSRLFTNSLLTCSLDAGQSRLNILTAYREPGSTNVSNFSVISCIPKYWITFGNLNSTTAQGASSPTISSFATDPKSAFYYKPFVLWEVFELSILFPGCVDPEMQLADTNNEFSRYVYQLSSSINPESPLDTTSIIQAAQGFFSTSFAIHAAMSLYTEDPDPTNSTGTYFRDETRLIVVSPVAYMILVPLFIVAFLNIAVLFYARERSILSEEAVGILSVAGMVRRSTDLQDEVTVLMHDARFDGKIRKAALKSRTFLRTMWYYNDHEKKISKKTVGLDD